MRRTPKVAATLAAAALMVVFSATPAQALVDPGFEDPASLTFDGPPFVGFWEGFNNGGSNTTSYSSLNPRSGASSLELFLGDPSGFAGVFQDHPIVGGSDVTWSGWHALGSGFEPGGTEIRIEWFDAGGAGLGATPNLTPLLTADGTYVPFSLTATAPATAATARAVYAIQSFGAPIDQQVFVDDVNIEKVIPEPTALGLAALAGLAIVARRRG